MADDAHWIVLFAQNDAGMHELLGGTGANLAEIARIGLPVPPGFTATTEADRSFRAAGDVSEGLDEQVDAALADLEAAAGDVSAIQSTPLLLSVRSGAVFSTPGMLHTVLDLGATDVTAPALRAMGDEAFAWAATRRFTELFSRVALGVEAEVFDSCTATQASRPPSARPRCCSVTSRTGSSVMTCWPTRSARHPASSCRAHASTRASGCSS